MSDLATISSFFPLSSLITVTTTTWTDCPFRHVFFVGFVLFIMFNHISSEDKRKSTKLYTNPLKTRMKSGSLKEYALPAPLVTRCRVWVRVVHYVQSHIFTFIVTFYDVRHDFRVKRCLVRLYLYLFLVYNNFICS
jgi:hypothetical protein